MREDLTVVIGNLGQLKHLRPCLNSLFSTTGVHTSLRVVVGFNFSGHSDAPQEIAAEFPQVAQLRLPAKLGYCYVYNRMIEQCSSRYVLLLDDDTTLQPGTIDGMVRFMDAHPKVGIAGCRTRNPDGGYQKSTALTFTLKTEAANMLRPAAFWHDGIDENVTDWQLAEWLNGHFLMVRAEVIQQVGTLDEYYYTFLCEADWCLRIHRAGWQVAYVPDFEVVHVRGEHGIAPGVKSLSNLIRAHTNRYYFIAKHHGDGALPMFRLIMAAGATLRLLRYVAAWLVSPQRRLEAELKIKAYTRIVLFGAATPLEPRPEQSGQNLSGPSDRPVTK